MCTRSYRNECIITVLRDLIFTGGISSFATRHESRFPRRYDGTSAIFEVPIAMVALVATGVCSNQTFFLHSMLTLCSFTMRFMSGEQANASPSTSLQTRSWMYMPRLFAPIETVPTNVYVSAASITCRVSKAWSASVGAGPVWQIVDDLGWFREAERLCIRGARWRKRHPSPSPSLGRRWRDRWSCATSAHVGRGCTPMLRS